jgi:hypothetical protein
MTLQIPHALQPYLPGLLRLAKRAVGCYLAFVLTVTILVGVPLFLMNWGESEPGHNFQATVGIPLPAGATVVHSKFFGTFGDSTSQLLVKGDASVFAAIVKAGQMTRAPVENLSAGGSEAWWRPTGDLYFSDRSRPRGLCLWHDAANGHLWIYEMDNPIPDPSFFNAE